MPNIRRLVLNLIIVTMVLLLGGMAWYLLSDEAMVEQQRQLQQLRLSVHKDVPSRDIEPIRPEIHNPKVDPDPVVVAASITTTTVAAAAAGGNSLKCVTEQDPPFIETVVPKASNVAWVLTLVGDGYLDMALVYAKGQRDLKTRGDIVLLLVDVSEEALRLRWPKIMALRVRVSFSTQPFNNNTVTSDEFRAYENKANHWWEFVKFRALQMLDYEMVIMNDADVLHLTNNDNLFDEAPGTCTDGPWSPVNGGFVVVRPSQEDYQFVADAVNGGAFNKKDYWGHTGMPTGYKNHAPETQGLWYYLYQRTKKTGTTLPRTIYNVQDVDGVRTELVRSVHFTWCEKPLKAKNPNPKCLFFHDKWLEVWHSLETVKFEGDLPPMPFKVILPARRIC